MSSLDADAPSGIDVGALGFSHAKAGMASAAHRTVIETKLFIFLSKLTIASKAPPEGSNRHGAPSLSASRRDCLSSE
jgi:hypothetical protein